MVEERISEAYIIEPESNLESLSNYGVDDFTYLAADFLNSIDYFGWVLRTSHGFYDPEGEKDYMIWPNDTESKWGEEIIAIKKNDVVIFEHQPGHDWFNVMIQTGQILNQAVSWYTSKRDETVSKIIEQYCKGISAAFKAMLWSEKDNLETFIMSRNIIPQSHKYTLNNRKKIVDYNNWRCETDKGWVGRRVHNPNNPYWGDVYVSTSCPKDDLPHIFRAAALLPNVIRKGGDNNMIQAAQEALYYLQGFCRDIIEHNFRIRTKNEKGIIYYPKGSLAKFYAAETNAKLALKLLGYGEQQGMHYSDGRGRLFDQTSCNINYFNYKILNGFHMNALLLALNLGEDKTANKLLSGLERRTKRLMKGLGAKKGMKRTSIAVYLLQAASLGLELKPEHVSLIHTEFSKAISEYENFQQWDLWDESVPEGEYVKYGGWRPNCKGFVRPEELGFLFEYFNSPYKNQEGLQVINPKIFSQTF